MVFVINKQGNPLMPTERHGKVRRLLRDGLAHVVMVTPFTIQLDYETTNYTQDITLVVDSESNYISLTASTEKKELFSAEYKRDDIVDKISTRRELQRTRRSRKRRYRKTKFNNKAKKKDRLAPS